MLADRYRAADSVLGDAGMRWYEISNWAATDAALPPQPRLLALGATGGASGRARIAHIGGVRWWNVLRPAAYAARLAAGRSPAAGRERLAPAERRHERIMLEVRLAEGLALRRRRPRAAPRPGSRRVAGAWTPARSPAAGRS